jgi:transposase
VIEVKEILRLWLEGCSLRAVTTLAGVDRKTVRRYVDAAQAAGLTQECGPGQLSDERRRGRSSVVCSRSSSRIT